MKRDQKLSYYRKLIQNHTDIKDCLFLGWDLQPIDADKEAESDLQEFVGGQIVLVSSQPPQENFVLVVKGKNDLKIVPTQNRNQKLSEIRKTIVKKSFWSIQDFKFQISKKSDNPQELTSNEIHLKDEDSLTLSDVSSCRAIRIKEVVVEELKEVEFKNIQEKQMDEIIIDLEQYRHILEYENIQNLIRVLTYYGQTRISLRSKGKVAEWISDALIEWKSKDFKAFMTNITKIKKSVIDVDFFKIRAITDLAEKEGYRLREKKVLAFLGVSGAGKSTTIHFLSGSKMAQGRLPTGVSHIGPVEVSDQASSIQTGPYSFSVTKFIQSAEVKYHHQKITLVDTPGFEDSQGTEIDVSNGIGVIKALQNAKAVNLVVFFSKQSVGDRMQGLKTTLQTFGTDMVTKTPQEEKGEVHSILIHDLLEKLKKDQVVFVDPLSDDPHEVLSQLIDKVDSIQDPTYILQPYFSTQSLSKVQQQMYRYASQFDKAMDANDIKEAAYCISQVQFISSIMDNQQITDQFNNSVKRVELEYEQQRSDLQTIVDGFIDGNELQTLDEVQTFLTKAKVLLSYKKEMKEFLKPEILEASSDFKSQLISKAKASFDKAFYENDPLKLRNLINRTKIVTDCIVEVLQVKDQTICQLIEKLFNQIESFKRSFNDKKAEDASKTYWCIIDVLSAFSDTKELAQVEQEFIATQREMKQELDQEGSHLKQYFGLLNSDTDRGINGIKDLIESLKFMNEQFQKKCDKAAHLVKLPEMIKNTQDNVFDQIQEYSNTMIKNLTSEIKDTDVQGLTFLSWKIALQVDLNNLDPSIKQKLQGSLIRVNTMISEKIYASVRDVLTSLTSLLGSEGNNTLDTITYELKRKKESLDQAYQAVSVLKIFQNDSDYESQISQQFKGFIADKIGLLKTQIENAKFNLDKPDIILNTAISLIKMKHFVTMFNEYTLGDQETSTIDQLAETFTSQVSTLLEESTQCLETLKQVQTKKIQITSIDQLYGFTQSLLGKHKDLYDHEMLQPIKQKLMQTEEEILNTIKEFVNQSKDLVSGKLDSILQAENFNEGQLQNDIAFVCQRIEDLTRLETKTVNLKSKVSKLGIQKLKKSWESQIQLFSDDFGETILRSIQIDFANIKVQTMMSIAKQLIALDNYNHGSKFREINSSAISAYYKKAPEIKSEIEEYLKLKDYGQLVSEYPKLLAKADDPAFSKNLQLINKKIIREVKEEISDTERNIKIIKQRNALKTDRFDKILVGMNHIKICIQLQELDTSDQFTFIKAAYDEMQDMLLTNLISHLREGESNLQTNTFKPVQAVLDDFEYITQMYSETQLLEEYSNLETKLKQHVKQLIQDYQNSDFEKVAENPMKIRQIFRNIEGLEHIPQFKEFKEDFFDVIKQKLIRKINSTVESEIYAEKALEHIKQVASQLLPQELQYPINVEVMRAMDTAKSKEHDFETSLTHAIDDKKDDIVLEVIQSNIKIQNRELHQKLQMYKRERFQHLDNQDVKASFIQQLSKVASQIYIINGMTFKDISEIEVALNKASESILKALNPYGYESDSIQQQVALISSVIELASSKPELNDQLKLQQTLINLILKIDGVQVQLNGQFENLMKSNNPQIQEKEEVFKMMKFIEKHINKSLSLSISKVKNEQLDKLSERCLAQSSFQKSIEIIQKVIDDKSQMVIDLINKAAFAETDEKQLINSKNQILDCITWLNFWTLIEIKPIKLLSQQTMKAIRKNLKLVAQKVYQNLTNYLSSTVFESEAIPIFKILHQRLAQICQILAKVLSNQIDYLSQIDHQIFQKANEFCLAYKVSIFQKRMDQSFYNSLINLMQVSPNLTKELEQIKEDMDNYMKVYVEKKRQGFYCNESDDEEEVKGKGGENLKENKEFDEEMKFNYESFTYQMDFSNQISSQLVDQVMDDSSDQNKQRQNLERTVLQKLRKIKGLTLIDDKGSFTDELSLLLGQLQALQTLENFFTDAVFDNQSKSVRDFTPSGMQTPRHDNRFSLASQPPKNKSIVNEPMGMNFLDQIEDGEEHKQASAKKSITQQLDQFYDDGLQNEKQGQNLIKQSFFDLADQEEEKILEKTVVSNDQKEELIDTKIEEELKDDALLSADFQTEEIVISLMEQEYSKQAAEFQENVELFFYLSILGQEGYLDFNRNVRLWYENDEQLQEALEAARNR